ncbi:hypothetical protein EVAR_82172_1 [Eumeta japonica]|uniref:Uncharacterized protein n=1 Tax=Eumeta variegata TaxID=151549 RepID=A0A4C1U2C5_EUMVA|nr:hypothetical protein EVAR_82172_1 [Eumeta japonica]
MVSVEVHTPKGMRTSAETESGAFVSLQAVGEFAGQLSLCEEIEHPPTPTPETAAIQDKDLTQVSIKDDRPNETEPSISRTASIVNKLALEAKAELKGSQTSTKMLKKRLSANYAIGELALRLGVSPGYGGAGAKKPARPGRLLL